MSTEAPTFSYVQVARHADDGFWEVDHENKKALFRESTHKRQKDNMLHDWTEVHQTITDYLMATQQPPIHVKEIIPDRKYIFSNEPICAHFDVGMVAHNPNQKLHCTATASVIMAGRPLCNKHASINFQHQV